MTFRSQPTEARYFATLDSDDGRIVENANIVVFATREEAVTYLKSAYDPADWNHDTMIIEPGRFGDCWIKSYSAPKDDERWFEPFTRDELSILRPGQHPGGRAWWIEPTQDVLVVAYLEEAPRSRP